MKRFALAALFIGTVIGANWALSTWGVIPIGFGLSAPAGVLFAGIAFGLRDGLHEAGGSRWVLACIAIGAVLSYVIEDAVTISGGLAPIAVASGVAFGLSELLDWAVYTPLRERNWPVAVVASNVVGAVTDSALFLWLAFGSLDYIAGQIVGKSYMIAAALPVVWMIRRDLPRHTVNSAGA